METTENPFKIRTYGFSELAQLYMPDICKKSAGFRMRVWIRQSDKLLTKLQEAGYKESQRLFTPKQVEVIVEHLGKP